ncbi:chymotrypsinogen 2-like [Oppia nitens]|uniref:chymotrypsinogen 2-like n=1 Tax=Oppia nitens TaxID=1686743 RepID=UPI0023DA37DF|nr:chymotrypsinogen 2-like [Oppia nitens]
MPVSIQITITITTDIGLIKLRHKISLYDPLVDNTFLLVNQAICLPELNSINTKDQLIIYAGFGVIDNNNTLPNWLQIGWNKILTITRNYIVAKPYPPGSGSGICWGDSGGPLYQYVNGKAILIGIGKGGNGGCSNNQINMFFVKVTLYIDWIIETVQNNN